MKLRAQLKIDEKTIVGYSFNCPGCGHEHTYWTAEFYSQQVWEFNGDINKPTFNPSLKNTWNEGDVAKCCHLFVTGGMITYCGDCTHHLNGQTVPLPEYKE